MCKINEERGDLFKTKDLLEFDYNFAYAHCISQDCAMGKGIAKTFVKKYPKIKGYCKHMIYEYKLEYPCSIPYTDDSGDIIFNLVTKKNYYDKPTYKTVRKALEIMAIQAEEFNINYLAIPLIGCGLDKLNWGKVKQIIEEVFENSDINIIVRYL